MFAAFGGIVRHHRLAAVAVLMITGSVIVGPALPAAPANSAFPEYVFFLAVTCPSTSSCVAAGTFNPGSTGNVVPGVAQWNGTKWTTTEVPVPPDPPSTRRGSDSHGTLFGVTCATTTSCFAVGSYTILKQVRTLIERWDGRHWVLVARPRPTGATSSELYAVSCVSATSCVAVGTATITGSGRQTFAVHWNGAQWSNMSTPGANNAVVNELRGVSCTAATNCFAVGTFIKTNPGGPFVEHWDGTSWAIVPSVNAFGGALRGVSCVSATNCYAAGNTRSGDRTFIEHWNGSKWSTVNIVNPPSASAIVLRAISCSAVNRCFAVGKYNTPKASSDLFEHWNGARWTAVNVTGLAAHNAMYGVGCRSQTFCVAVGGPLVDRWNGTQWTADRTAP